MPWWCGVSEAGGSACRHLVVARGGLCSRPFINHHCPSIVIRSHPTIQSSAHPHSSFPIAQAAHGLLHSRAYGRLLALAGGPGRELDVGRPIPHARHLRAALSPPRRAPLDATGAGAEFGPVGLRNSPDSMRIYSCPCGFCDEIYRGVCNHLSNFNPFPHPPPPFSRS